MFYISQKNNLMNKVDPDVISRIVGEISISQTVEEQEGN
jgi:hypothetical protein